MNTLHDIERGAIEEFIKWAKNNRSDDPDGTIHKIAGDYVSIHPRDLLQIASDNLEFATEVPELSPTSATSLIIANMREYIEAQLWEVWWNAVLCYGLEQLPNEQE